MGWTQMDPKRRQYLEEVYNHTDMPVRQISAALGVHPSTVYRELKRGDTGKLNSLGMIEYSAKLAEDRRATTRRRRRT